MLLHPLWLGLGLALMAPESGLLPLADSYASIRIASAPAVLATYAMVGWFIGHGDTRWPMLILITTNLVNILLDVVLVVGLGLNSDGAAMATVLAEYCGCGLAAYGLDGFAYAVEILAGGRAGAGDREGFYHAVRRCGFWCAVGAVLLSIAFLVLQQPLFALLTSLPEVREILHNHRLWLVLLPLVAAPTYLLDGVFIGTTETRDMMLTMLASALLVYLPVWYLSQPWGNHGLWLAFTLFNGARGVSLYLCYRRLSLSGGWFDKR